LPVGQHTISLPNLPKGNYQLRAGSKQTKLLIQ